MTAPTRRTNAPYAPIFFPDLADPWRGWLRAFLRFCERVTIPSKDYGAMRLAPLFASQRYVIEEIFYALSLGLHDVLILKSRQLGVSTVLWAFDLWWAMKWPALQAAYIADSDENKELHRDIISGMYQSLPPRHSRGPWRANNRLELTWRDAPAWAASRILWMFANKKSGGQLGRSRGVNYIHGTEMDSWDDEDGVAALDATRSTKHPRRLYLWEGTGQGYGLLYQMWEQAERSVATHRVFVGWWRREDHIVTRDETALWNAYGAPKPSPDEIQWAKEVRRRFGWTITREQLAWWRYTKAEGKGINGDEAVALQEHPWLPEHSFQAGGSQFVSAGTLLRMRLKQERSPTPRCYRYDWGATFDAKGDDALTEVSAGAATLTVWEEPVKGCLYIVAGDPAYGSSETADAYAVTVWRVHPDAMVQVAEYQTQAGTMYQFAWTLVHLAGNYPRWLIYDVNGPGAAVMQEIDRMRDYGFGLKVRGDRLHHVVGTMQEYLWARPDALSPSYSRQWKTAPGQQEALMEKLRDMSERGALVVRSRALLSEIGALRRHQGRIEPGGVAKDDLAVTAAMAVECFLESVLGEIDGLVAPHDAPPPKEQEPTTMLVRNFMRRLQQPDDEEPKRTYGVQYIQGVGR